MRNIDNTEDILDSRDVIARRDELKDERDTIAEEIAELETLTEDDPTYGDRDARRDELKDALAEWNSEYAQELADLEAFIAEGNSEWEYGETLIRDTYFKEYAQELAEDVCELPSNPVRWPYTCIDWDQAARELQYDYSSADFAGVTYWFRS